MIRIDEIYTNLFWPFMDKRARRTRMFYCDPPGATQPENLYNFGHESIEDKYIFFHDQEPVHPEVHYQLFNTVDAATQDLCDGSGALVRGIVTSEFRSDDVKRICDHYEWNHYYYFFHGWAVLDWYRGYDKTFLISNPQDRTIEYSMLNPNRIIGGKRDHRILLYYMMMRNNVKNSLTSFPKICPVEQRDVLEIAEKFRYTYPDIVNVLSNQTLPQNFPDETGHPMHSCWLSLFDLAEKSLLHVVTETVFFGKKNHLTEKTFKPICLKMPFVLASNALSLEYLRRYGFHTFSDVWDESYDEETDDHKRLEKIAQLLADIDALSAQELAQLHRHVQPAVEHNFQHFYSGEFERILWQELQNVLQRIERDFTFG